MTGQPQPPVLETRDPEQEREELWAWICPAHSGVPSGLRQAASKVIPGTMTTFRKSSEAQGPEAGVTLPEKGMWESSQ